MVSLDWYQNARLTASADFTSNDITFTATNILPLIADKVGTIYFVCILKECDKFSCLPLQNLQLVVSGDAVELDVETYTLHGRAEGRSVVTLDIQPPLNVTVDVSSNNITVHKLDPIVATLRLSLDSVPESRLEQGSVTLGVLFLQEEVAVSASVVFTDGHRSLIRDPLELTINSSNSSIVSVSGGIVRGESEGVAVVNITWVNPSCLSDVLSAEVVVIVIVDDSRPTFVPSEETAYVPENSPIGTNVATVQALVQTNSGDIRDTDDVRYRFQNGLNFDGLFSLDPASGEVVLNGQLDRESISSYTLYIEATNSAQRRAEQGDTLEEGEEGGEMVSGSGGSGGDLLVPEPTPGNRASNISLNIAVLTVSTTRLA